MINLFFDDQRLFAKTGVNRVYGKPKLIKDSAFYREKAYPSNGLPSVWYDEKNKLYHMFYQVFLEEGGQFPLGAISEDGIHWKPRNTAKEAGIENPLREDQLFPTFNGELAFVLEDKHAKPDERLRAFVCIYNFDQLLVEDVMYTSGDGIHWKKDEKNFWNQKGAEPGAGGFWSDATKSYIITARPGWGDRRVCTFETKDFVNFSEPKLALQCDSTDEAFVETYGLSSFEYKGWYLGFLWMYHTIESNSTKFIEGTMNCQLAYSFNGLHWQRSLRYPFIDNEKGMPTAGMVFPAAIIEKDGELLIYAGATPHEHGHFAEKGAAIVAYKLREDGFIKLEAENDGSIFTRQLLWYNGEINVNIVGENITVAVYDIYSNPIQGFTHEDCIPFSGDSTKHIPKYKNGLMLDSFAGKVITIEIKWSRGSLYSYSGNFENLMNQEAERYIKFGTIPDKKGF